LTAVLGLVAAGLQALGYALYVGLFLRKRIRPNAASSFMFAYGTALLVLLEWKDGARWEILALPVTCSLASIGVAMLCLRKGATEPVDRIEATAFFADVWLTVLWAMIAFGYGNVDPFSAGFLLAGNVTTLTAFFPVLRSTWLTPHREQPWPWAVWTLAYGVMAAVTLLADRGAHPMLLVYPLLSVALHGSVAVMSLRAAGALGRRQWVNEARTIFLAQSRIDGFGMFSGRGFEAGDEIWQMTGQVMFGAPTPQHGPNWIGLGPDVWIDPDSPLDRINHHCAPNAAFGAHRRLRALRRILPGEEITVDYSTTEADPGWSMHCSCDAPDCRVTLRAIQYSFAERLAPPPASPLMQLIWLRRADDRVLTSESRAEPLPTTGWARIPRLAGVPGERRHDQRPGRRPSRRISSRV
jgi:hypothetical protein